MGSYAPIPHRHTGWLVRACTAAAFLLAGLLWSNVSKAQQPPPFTRVVVTKGETLNVQSNGTQLIVTLSAPGNVTAQSLKAQLGTRATNVVVSEGGKRFTVTLTKPFRVRQFMSSRGAGFDVMEDTAPSVLPQPWPEAPAKPSPKPVIHAVTEVKKETINPPANKAPDTIPKKSEEKKHASPPAAQKEVPPPRVKEEAAIQRNAEATEAPPPATDKITEPVTPAAEPAPPPPITSLPVPKEALDAAAQPITLPASIPATTEPSATPSPPPITDLTIGVISKAPATELAFQWEHRVAASLFQRDRDWWLVFSAPSRIDTAQLQSILPAGLTLFDPYQAQGYTVLHFLTDGKSTLSAAQRKGSYDWYISVAPGAPSTPEAYALDPITNTSKPHVVIRAFDVAAPLSFTDPKYGDRVLVVPSYEPGKALITTYATPEFAVIPARQGIVLQLNNEELELTTGRDGLRLGSQNGLKLSKDLPSLPIENAAEAENIPNIMFPYARWQVATKDFIPVRIKKTQTLANASQEEKPQALHDLATLYLGQGMAEEALSLLNQLRDRFPAYYRENEIALLRAAANFLIFRMSDAASDIMSSEIAENPETQLWKDAISIFVPQIIAPAQESSTQPQPGDTTATTPPSRFDYLAYNPNFIRYYPPRIRQKLAIIAADNFIANKEYSKAARTLDLINRDGLLTPIRRYAEFLLGRIAADSGKPEQAIKMWTPLAKQYDDIFIHARAAFSLATAEYSTGKRTLDDTIRALEALRVMWRGDTLEQNLLSYLGELYFQKKDYANALRTWKDFMGSYGGSAEGLSISNKMAELFERLYGDEALADTMDPLRSLALFYEFRTLSPIGARGDAIIQKLANRLAKVDLLDKAAELLDHQVKFRVQGVERARLGAQLALLQILNKNPEKALEALEISGYGTAPGALAADRNRLAALALSQVKKTDIALEMLASDRSPRGQELRLEILWNQQDWPNVVNVAEDMLGSRPNIAAPLSPKETDILLKLSLAYSFEGDMTQLKYLRGYYSPFLKESPYKDIFEYITDDTASLDPEDFAMVAKQISQTESFLKTFRDKIAEGRLSTALEEESETAEEEESPSEQNSKLVPESQLPASNTEAENPEAQKRPTSSEPQRAPVEVTPKTNAEITPQEEKEEEPTSAPGDQTNPEPSPEAGSAPPQNPPQ